MSIEAAKAQLTAPFQASFGSLGQLLENTLRGIANTVIGLVHGVVGAIGSLFTMGHQDTAAVDRARVEGELSIVENLSRSLDHMDEIQRFGGAYMNYPSYRITYGELDLRVIPLNAGVLPPGSDAEAGTRTVGPHTPLTHSADYTYNRTAARPATAKGSGYLELLEDGLWVIDFQAGMVQGGQYPNRPASLWCHITPAHDPRIPVGPPGLDANGLERGVQFCINRITGDTEEMEFDEIAAYGRAASYVRTSNPVTGGGITVAGKMYAMLPSGNWKVTLSGQAYHYFGGASTTFVYATKVNSEQLRSDINELREGLAEALPGRAVDMTLDEAAIQAMLTQSEGMGL